MQQQMQQSKLNRGIGNQVRQIDSYNLDIEQYDIKDLEKLFGLQDLKYRKSDVEKNEYTIRERLNNDRNIDFETRTRIINFYVSAKAKLLSLLPLSNAGGGSKPSTTFQYGGHDQLDSSDNVWLPVGSAGASMDPQYGRADNILDVYDQKSGRRDQNEVLRHSDKDFVNANVSNVFAGVINPLNTRFINKYMTIDSRFRDMSYAVSSGSLTNTSSDFTINLPDKIQRVVGIQLASLEIPITYYATSAYIGNNYVTVSVTDLSSNITSGVAVVPDGTYTPATLGSALTAGFTALGGLISTISVLYSVTNGHYTVASTSSSVASFKLDFTTTLAGNTVSYVVCDDTDLNKCEPVPELEYVSGYNEKSPGKIDLTRRLGYSLGFKGGVYSGAKSYISESVANTTGTRYLFLAVDDFNNNVVSNQFMTIAPQNINSKNILARITVGNGGFLSILTENDFKIITDPRKYFGPVDITKLRVQLYDDYGTILNMNGGDFSFNLLLEVVYDL
jgi:hypothetical protein